MVTCKRSSACPGLLGFVSEQGRFVVLVRVERLGGELQIGAALVPLDPEKGASRKVFSECCVKAVLLQALYCLRKRSGSGCSGYPAIRHCSRVAGFMAHDKVAFAEVSHLQNGFDRREALKVGVKVNAPVSVQNLVSHQISYLRVGLGLGNQREQGKMRRGQVVIAPEAPRKGWIGRAQCVCERLSALAHGFGPDPNLVNRSGNGAPGTGLW